MHVWRFTNHLIEPKGTVPYPVNPFGTYHKPAYTAERDSPLAHKSFRYLVPGGGGGGGGGRDEVCIVYSRESYRYELSAVHIIPE